MRERTWSAKDPVDLERIVPELLHFAGNRKVFLLHGDLGAGKTTFVKTVCAFLKVEDLVNSPTFSIVQEYLLPEGDRVFHFDLYRVKNASELFDLGFEHYLDSGSYCFIEWPEKAEGLLNQPKADIFITVKENVRVISCSYE